MSCAQAHCVGSKPIRRVMQLELHKPTMAIGYSLRMCARHVDSTNPGRSDHVFRSKPIPEAEMSNRLIGWWVLWFWIKSINQTSTWGPSIKYVTLFLANFYPPPLSHIPGPPRKYVTHLGTNVPSNFISPCAHWPASWAVGYCKKLFVSYQICTLSVVWRKARGCQIAIF